MQALFKSIIILKSVLQREKLAISSDQTYHGEQTKEVSRGIGKISKSTIRFNANKHFFRNGHFIILNLTKQDLEKHITQRQQLESQLTENKFVKDVWILYFI